MLPRQKLVLEFWDRSGELRVNNVAYKNFIKKLFDLLLKSDINGEDITTNSLIKKKSIYAHIIAKEDGVIAGLEEFRFLNKGFKLSILKKDGDKIKKGDIIAEINGSNKKMLSMERTSLNLLQRMSGIATLTNSLNKKLRHKIKIAATRKTLWGLLDKKAVSVGGGLTHRLSLNDGVIIKDNHLKIIGYDFKKAINSVKNKSRYIEIEVENAKRALNAAKVIKNIVIKSKNRNSFVIMLDKIKPGEIKSVIKELKIQNLYKYMMLEASGNITSKNIKEYSYCGVDVISMGSITNSSKVLDMSLKVR